MQPLTQKIISVLVNLLRLLGIFFLLSFERVVGLPLIFSLLGLMWLDHKADQRFAWPLLVTLFSFMITVSYALPWFLTFVLWVLSAALIKLGEVLVKDKKRRFLIVVIIQNLAWLWLSGIIASYVLLVQFVASYLLVMMWLKILRVRRGTTV
jgi:hypothetical protein